MKDAVDVEEFERLTGPDFNRYLTRARHLHINDDFLKYFRERKGALDGVHLELALWWLGKLGSLEAYHEIVQFIEHSSRSVQFMATGLVFEMPHEMDNYIVSTVIAALKQRPDPTQVQCLGAILKKPASKDARDLADDFLKNGRCFPSV